MPECVCYVDVLLMYNTCYNIVLLPVLLEDNGADHWLFEGV